MSNCLRRLTLFVLLGAALTTPAAMAQEFGIDQEFNDNLGGVEFAGGPALDSAAAASAAATGSGANSTQSNAWSDFDYVQQQQAAPKVPGTLRAPLHRRSQGMASTFVGNRGQFIRGRNPALGKSLRKTKLGLNAISGGYILPACDYAGPGGFFGGIPSFSSPYPYLPPTSTSFVDLNVTVP